MRPQGYLDAAIVTLSFGMGGISINRVFVGADDDLSLLVGLGVGLTLGIWLFLLPKPR